MKNHKFSEEGVASSAGPSPVERGTPLPHLSLHLDSRDSGHRRSTPLPTAFFDKSNTALTWMFDLQDDWMSEILAQNSNTYFIDSHLSTAKIFQLHVHKCVNTALANF